MWARMAIGALVGLVIGHFTQPGYAMWIVLGITAGYAAEVWAQRSLERKERASNVEIA